MKILALIPARGGSKRLPGKNIRKLDGVPLIMRTINAVEGIPEICDVLVSTDDVAVVNICSQASVLIPWLRPEILSSDEASSIDVALHALDWYEDEKGPVDALLLLQPTSPFRTKEIIKEGIQLYKKFLPKAVIGVSPVSTHPMWMVTINDGRLESFMSQDSFEKRSQDLPSTYVVNGAFYLIQPEELRGSRSFLTRNTIPLIMNSPKESLDIDTEFDWQLAEWFASNELDIALDRDE